MPAPMITRQPEPEQTIAAGETARLAVVATGAAAYQWRADGDPIAGATRAEYETPAAKKGAADVTYTVVVTSADGEATTSERAVVKVKPSEDGKEPLLVYDRTFAKQAAWSLIGMFVLLLIPLWWLAFDELLGGVGEGDGGILTRFPALIAVQLVIVGVLVALAGVYLALLELRGRSRTPDELARLAATGQEGVAASLAPVDLAKIVPEALKAFSKLRAPAALLVIAAVCFVCATVIATEALPEREASQQTAPTGPTGPTGGSGPTGSRGAGGP